MRPGGLIDRSAVRAAARVCDLQLPGPVEQVGTRGSAGRATRQHEQSKAVLKPVVRRESGWAAVGSRGGSSRGGGVGGIPKVRWQVQVQVVDGRGWCTRSTCLGRDWAGLGVGLETAELPGDHGQQGGTGHKIGVYGKMRCSCATWVLQKRRWDGGRPSAKAMGGRAGQAVAQCSCGRFLSLKTQAHCKSRVQVQRGKNQTLALNHDGPDEAQTDSGSTSKQGPSKGAYRW